MKEFAFILVVVLALIAITVFRYRRQIAGFINFARVIRSTMSPPATRNEITDPARKVGSQLIHCAECKTLFPRDRSIRFDAETYYCSNQCVKLAVGQ